MSVGERFLAYHAASSQATNSLADDDFLELYSNAVDVCVSAIRSGHRIFIAGNGGSHADAIHIAGELVNYFTIPHAGYPVMALGCNPAVVTSWGNDQSFEDQFARELSAFASKNDVFICITTSGKSQNIHKAIAVGREIGVKVIALTSKTGAEHLTADVVLAVKSDRTPHIQEAHIVIYHSLCAEIEYQLSK